LTALAEPSPFGQRFLVLSPALSVSTRALSTIAEVVCGHWRQPATAIGRGARGTAVGSTGRCGD
jgi:hypothetical protein